MHGMTGESPAAHANWDAGSGLLRALVETTSDAVLVTDPDGTVVFANGRSAALFGCVQPDELLGRRRRELLDDGRGEQAARRVDGMTVPVVVSESAIGDGGGEPAGRVLVVRDISEQRRLEDEHRAIFDATGDGMVVYTTEGVIVAANPAFCDMNGYTCEELIGRNVAMLVHPDFHGLVREFIDTIVAGGSLHARATNVRKDGSTFPVDVHGSVFLEVDRPLILGVARDVTDEVRAFELLEQRVEERTKELLTVLDVAHSVASVLDLEPLLELILNQLRTVIDCRRVILFKIENDRLAVRAVAAEDRPVIVAPKAKDVDDSKSPLSIPLGDLGLVWETLRRGDPAIVDDLQGDDPLARDYRSAVARYGLSSKGLRSWMMVPMVMQGRTIGVILLLHDRPNVYTADHAHLALAIADQAAVAMENARLFEQAQQSGVLEERQRLARELHDAVTQTLFSASLIAEMLPRLWARDPEAGMKRLEDVRALTRGALAEMRTLLLELRPAAIVEAELGELLRQLAEMLTGSARLPVAVTVEGEGTLPPEVRLAFYRVAQEALHNIDKHARASQVDLRLTVGEGTGNLSISDDGCGFDQGEGSRDGYAHFGLATMRERSQAVGATLSLRSEPGRGTEVRVHWSKARKRGRG